MSKFQINEVAVGANTINLTTAEGDVLSLAVVITELRERIAALEAKAQPDPKVGNIRWNSETMNVEGRTPGGVWQELHGLRGPQGPKGDKGDPGDRGPAGIDVNSAGSGPIARPIDFKVGDTLKGFDGLANGDSVVSVNVNDKGKILAIKTTEKLDA